MFNNSGYVRSVRANARLATQSAKMGQKFLETINSLEFRPEIFAHTIISGASEAIMRHILQTFFAVVNMMIVRYDSGEMTEATTMAKRLKDCMNTYQMEEM